MIPFINLQATYRQHRQAIDAAIQRVLDSGRYILGEEVARFEVAFAAACGAGHGVGVACGTDAITLALWALGIGPGDEVVTVAHTAVATVTAVELAGAHPVLVDVDPVSYTIDPAAAEAAITSRTKAIIPVHLYGQPADMAAILAVAARHGVAVIEDCAQAHGARYKDQPVGSFGQAAAFSFYPTKNLGAVGDGGMVVTNDAGLAGRLRRLRQYGWRERYVSSEAGMNSRLDEVQAAILQVLLGGLNQANEQRRRAAASYRQLLDPWPEVLPQEIPGRRHVYHLFVLRLRNRERLRRRLAAEGVATAIHYPVPVHLQPAYTHLGSGPGSLPVTEQLAGEVLSLPMYPQLPPEHIGRVASMVAEVLAEGAG